MIQINQIKLNINDDESLLAKKISSVLFLKKYKSNGKNPKFEYKIIRKSLDARKKPDLYFIYSVCVSLEEQIESKILAINKNSNILRYMKKAYIIPEISGDEPIDGHPFIIGDGPAGLFCAYLLCQKGLKPVVIERGQCIEERTKTVENFWEKNILNTESNVQFGEGGAGTFSDGKLNTSVSDKSGRNQYVLDTFVEFGAANDIAYLAKPHLGTDCLYSIIRNMRSFIENHGGHFVFNTRMTELAISGDSVIGFKAYSNNKKEVKIDNNLIIYPGENILKSNVIVMAIGHSSRDTFEVLLKHGINMKQKDFAVGFRIIHPQSIINKSQYGEYNVEGLNAADYKLVNHASNGKSVYSFCMCPGGYVVNASSENNRLAVNGMSYSKRDSNNANSAIVATVDANDFDSDDVLAGMYFQQKVEELAYKAGKGFIPVQRYIDYKNNVESLSTGISNPCIKGNYTLGNLRNIFSKSIEDAIIESIEKFGYTCEGFNMDDALLLGIESRTSSPVRMERNDDLECNIKGLYPCGEGAGYAGGITSAAMDGMKVAEKIIEKYFV